MHTLSVGEFTARNDLTYGVSPLQLFDLADNESVVNEYPIPDLKLVDKVLIRYRYASFVTDDILCREGEFITLINTVTKLSESEADGTVTLQVTTAPDTDLRDEIFFAMAERRYAVLSTETVEQSLEEIFLSLTAKKSKSKEVTD